MRVLAAFDNSPDAGPVAEFARALAKVLDASVDGLHVRMDGVDHAQAAAAQAGVPLRVEGDDPAACLQREADPDDVAAVVKDLRPSPAGAHDRRAIERRPCSCCPARFSNPGRMGLPAATRELMESDALAASGPCRPGRSAPGPCAASNRVSPLR
jgi:hypothetical protein